MGRFDLSMTCTRRLALFAVAAGIASAAVLGASSASAATLVMGKGVPPWRLGQEHVVKAGIERSERHPENAQAGCVTGLESATRIDYYPEHIVGILGGRVFDIVTTRPGDRSTTGFVIGRSRLRAVRATHPRAAVAPASHVTDPGAKSLGVYRAIGYETVLTLTYWFDSANVLVALETGAGGC